MLDYEGDAWIDRLDIWGEEKELHFLRRTTPGRSHMFDLKGSHYGSRWDNGQLWQCVHKAPAVVWPPQEGCVFLVGSLEVDKVYMSVKEDKQPRDPRAFREKAPYRIRIHPTRRGAKIKALQIDRDEWVKWRLKKIYAAALTHGGNRHAS